MNDPGNDLKIIVKKRLTYQDLRHHVPLKFKFYEHFKIERGNGMMFEENPAESDFEFTTEPRKTKFTESSNVLGVFWNQETLLPGDRTAYIAILREAEGSEQGSQQMIEIFDYESETKIYSVKVGMKCLEISFSVVKVEEKSSAVFFNIVVAILDSELRIYALTNDAKFVDRDQTLPVHSKVDLYDKELLGHAFGLKIDLAPRLDEKQVIYLLNYFEQSNNMLLYSYRRQIYQFDFDDRFCIDGKLVADYFDVDRTEESKELPPWQYVHKM